MAARATAEQTPQVWAGIECTVNRIGDSFRDQIERSGHGARPQDIKLLAELGVRKLRYPILWERTASRALNDFDWSWADERLGELRRLGLEPIVGLVHHGSGPRYTSLLDPAFPQKLATYAREVAQRYPWVIDYTPINEPLTTARFSCLYGHWYPHERDPLLFAKALLAQCRGVVLSLRAIREVNPAARLIQTEDLGKTFSTPTLAYQAEFENERRWLTFDLLCGRIGPATPMWDYLRWVGIEKSDLEWFVENQLQPDVIGVNHYLTSERFLDERLYRYPAGLHGGNGQQSYADVEAVRVCAEGVEGPKALLREAWERYHLPLAVTEVHLGCSREEQLRWLNEVWNAALSLVEEGVDVRAVTAWAAFGTFDWNNLLTRDDGCYEPGIFDLRAPAPRPTALARAVKKLAAGEEFDHPVLDTSGWWHRLDRLCYPPVTHRGHLHSADSSTPKNLRTDSRPLLIVGANGTLGQAFARICERRGLSYRLVSRGQMDIAHPDSVTAAIDQYKPWAIINGAGYVRVDDAESDRESCLRDNFRGPECLAKACASLDLPLVTFSSDLVFDGRKGAPYFESDLPAPINIYGKSKAAAEDRVLELFPAALIIRTSAFFGPWDKFNFAHAVLETLSKGHNFVAAGDTVISPTYVPDLVNATLDLLIDGENGIWHLANGGDTTWADFARAVAVRGGYNESKIHSRPLAMLGLEALRPAFTVLASERGSLMPSFEEGLDRFFLESQWRPRERVAAARV